MKIHISDGLYDALNRLVLILPAAATFYSAISAALGYPVVEEVMAFFAGLTALCKAAVQLAKGGFYETHEIVDKTESDEVVG